MSKKAYKVRDKGTGTFWNGDSRWSKFSTTGKTWRTRKSAEDCISRYCRYSLSFKPESVVDLIKKWEVVEVEITETVSNSHDIDDMVKSSMIKHELQKLNYRFIHFYETMQKRGVHNSIEFIFELKEAEGTFSVGKSQIIEARAHLRQLGVKTRTFREYNGMFGMMNREQAMKARLTLDVQTVVDLGEIRRKVISDLGL